MKQTVAYSAYFLVTGAVTYLVGILLFFMISSVLFIAADGPPGDISDNGKLFLSVGIPVIYAAILFTLYNFYSTILNDYNIHLLKTVGVLFHILTALYLIWNAVPYAF